MCVDECRLCIRVKISEAPLTRRLPSRAHVPACVLMYRYTHQEITSPSSPRLRKKATNMPPCPFVCLCSTCASAPSSQGTKPVCVHPLAGMGAINVTSRGTYLPVARSHAMTVLSSEPLNTSPLAACNTKNITTAYRCDHVLRELGTCCTKRRQ